MSIKQCVYSPQFSMIVKRFINRALPSNTNSFTFKKMLANRSHITTGSKNSNFPSRQMLVIFSTSYFENFPYQTFLPLPHKPGESQIRNLKDFLARYNILYCFPLGD